MILTALANYYEQLRREHPKEVPEQGWSRVKVTHLLVLSREGELLNIIPASDKDGWTKRVPERVKRSSGIAPNLLADNSSYLLGIDSKGKPERAKRCFEAAKKAHLEAFAQVSSAAGVALCAFFKTWDPEVASINEFVAREGDSLLAGGNLSFVLDGTEMQDIAGDEEVARAYAKLSEAEGEDEEGDEECAAMRCLVTGKTGKRAPIARLHPPIKGLYGAQSTGASLVSFNSPAFESYGHDGGQGFNAPVSVGAAFAYTAALNYLIKSPQHHVRIGDTTVVYWAERGDTANSTLMSLLLGAQTDGLSLKLVDETQDAELESIMKSLSAGKVPNIEGLDQSAVFHVLGLAPNAARISVRFYERNTFGGMLENVMRHYRRMAIAHAPWQQDFLSPYWIVRAAENSNAKNPVVSSELGGALLRSILTDARYPESLYANIMLRLRATQDDEETHTVKVSYERAAFIKAYLIRNVEIYEEGTMETVNAERDEMAYVLGRVFWVLEDTQHVANPGINATISDKYFDTACTTPALVFPTLLTLSKKHLRKVKRDKPGLAHNLETELEALLARIESFPKSLSNTAQGDFVLGYYHQKSADIQERARKKQEQEADEAAALAE